ncbi:MAG TPA: phosphate ABC transporter permease PstA [Candidatus Acidoferrales bacterium]|nr:phosphate ABC transporter permease PstA [Candidatus Acidoferrales bacterium]
MNTHYRYRKFVERANWVGMLFCISITVFFLVAILGYVIINGASSINWEFLTALPVPAGESGGGIANALVGSLLIVLVATLMALPIGIGAAIFINEFPSHGTGHTIRFLAEVLTGVPSIVVGLFAYSLVVVPWGGFSAFSGSVAYAFIMVPIILISAHEALRLVPDSLREAALALGIPKWRTILGVVLPVSSRALTTGVVLAVSRALGEAAPMMFTAFGNSFWNLNIGKPMATVPLLIYTYATGPYEDWHRKAWGASFVLLVVVLVTSVLTRAFLRGKTNE